MKRTLCGLSPIVGAIMVATGAVLPARGDYLTIDIATHEAMADSIRFESRSWAENVEGDGGRLAANTVWSGGEHVILSDLYVPSGVTLTIGPGTVVRFREGTRIKVEDGGSLVLSGEAGNEVVLEGYDGETSFGGIVLQSGSAGYSDNSHIVVDGFALSKYATISLGDTSAFSGAGQVLVPVNVSGSRDAPFSFDWVAETNGVAFASGTMEWNRVSDGTKNIVVSFPDGLGTVSNFVLRAVTLRCCTPGKGQCVVKLGAFITADVAAHEALADFIAFESRDWAADVLDAATNDPSIAVERGRLQANATWDSTKTHLIVGDVYIPSGVTLSISVGTVVEFCEGTRIKIEDGGTLNVVGAEGHDVIFRGAEGSEAFGGIVKMPNGAYSDNSFVVVEGFSFGAYANVALNDNSTFRSSGLALVPVTVSGSRSTAFSIDWVAETNGVAYKTGTLRWNSVSEGTKNISIDYGAELDSFTNFTVRVAVDRACHSSPRSCTVKISDFVVADIAAHEATSDSIRFESREWAEGLDGEGGRLAANVTWSGKHVLLDDLYVPSGVTLTLAADAIVEFCTGTRIKIEDGGTLNVVGAEGHDVIFRGTEGAEAFGGIVKMSNGTFTDNMFVQFQGVPCPTRPDVSIGAATTYREAGTAFVAVSPSGTTRNQAFNVDWSTDKGDRGTLSWSSTSDGTKWIQIPIDGELVGGTTNHVVTITAARGCNVAVGTATLTVLEPVYVVKGQVSFTESETGSGEFAVNGDVKTQPIFLNDVETIQYSGAWQTYDAGEAATLRVTLGTDNGTTTLKECAPSETGAFDLDLTRYPVGRYTLKHEILDAYGETLATMQKVFSIADEEDVVLHGGPLAGNEVWEAGKVHVVYETVVVPSVYTIFIEPGAIVKFMTGTGIDISQGGAFFANRIVFTHVNDDTVGGDTLSDGFTVAPPMDAYFLAGAFTFGDDTELRGITQNTALSGTIFTRKMLSRGSTYRISGTLTISNGGSLTIPPGTVLKMESGASIVVNSGGTLDALGTRAAPIVITSVRDDSVSGDTNGDGGATIPQPGDWEEIRNNGGTMNLAHVTALYGGYGQYSNQGDAIVRTSGGTTTLDCCTVMHSNLRLLGRTGGTVYAENCVFADGRWGVDGAATLVNCVIADCNTGANGATLENSVLWACDTYATGGSATNCVAYGETGAVPAGMTFADPLFVDPGNGDFRILEGSPCVDAADADAAPEFDYFGQPRVTLAAHEGLVGQLADIGICEVMPRNVAADVDLVPQSVRTVTNAVPGQLLFVKWEVSNAGGMDLPDAAWRDTVSLVSAYGREVVLGEKISSGSIAAGGSVFCSGYFTVPAIPEGAWYPKVNVNSYHDIFEGALVRNNALVGERPVDVGLEALDPSVARDGVVNGGVPTVLKLSFAEGDANRMVRLDVPAGVRVAWGFGFMPQGASRSGSVVAAADGAMFRVPDDATDVYVVLESDATATYDLSTESTEIVISDVSPATLPSSGTTTLTITGAGFGDECTVSLSSAVGSYRLQSIAKDASGALVAMVDCAALKASTTYDLVVSGGSPSSTTATLQNAVTVAAVKGEGKFWARLVVPDSVREGRKVSCAIEYGNSGNADLPAQVLQVAMDGTGTLGYLDGLSGLKVLQFVAAGEESSAGVLRPGSSHQIRFVLLAGSNNTITLHSSVGSDYAPEPWTGTADYIADLSAAATRVGMRGQDSTDYRIVVDLAKAMNNGEPTSAIFGRVVDETGTGVEESLILFTNATDFVSCLTDESGYFCTTNLAPGAYMVFMPVFPAFNLKNAIAVDGNNDAPQRFSVDVMGTLTVTLKGVTDGGATLAAMSLDDDVCAMPWKAAGATHLFRGLPPGGYSVECCLVSGVRKSQIVYLEEKTALNLEFDFLQTGALEIDFGSIDTANAGFLLFDGVDIERMVTLNGDTLHTIEGLPIGDYTILFHIQGTGAYNAIPVTVSGDITTIVDVETKIAESEDEGENGEVSPASASAALRTVPASLSKAHSSVGAVTTLPPRALRWTGDGEKMERYTRELLAIPFPVPKGEYNCLHNRNLQAEKSRRREELVKELELFVNTMRWYDGQTMGREFFVDGAKDVVWEGVKKWVLEGVEGATHIVASAVFFATDTAKVAYEAYKEGSSGLYPMMQILANAWEREVHVLEGAGVIAAKGAAKLTFLNKVMAAATIGKGAGKAVAGLVIQREVNMTMEEAKQALTRKCVAYENILAQGYNLCCPNVSDIPPFKNWIDKSCPTVPRSCDPNEMAGPLGVGDPETERQLVPGEWATYTIYFENQTNATAAAQEVYVSDALSPNLDWSTFEMCEVAFGEQIDLGLAGKKNGTSDAAMEGTNLLVRTSLALDETTGLATWYMRIVDPTTDTGWPKDILAGFLPPNDPETHCGEGHVTYRVKVRADAAPGARIDASATIVFDYNDPIVTDPSWWNTVATVYKPTVDLGDGTTAALSLVVGQPYGQLPTPKAKAGYSFGGWFTGPNGTGTKISPTTIVEPGSRTIYPYWIPTTYKVVFNANGGTGKMAAQTVARNATAKLVANRFARSGWVFLGWAKTAGGAVAYANGAPVKNLAAAGKSATLYAKWAKKTYKVKFVANGGKGKMKAQTFTYGKAKKLTANKFKREGYVFKGWATSKSQAKKGKVKYKNKKSVKNLTATGKTVKLYAVWKKKQ